MDHRTQEKEANMWSLPAEDQVLLDEDCSPTKTCRNMVGISFDGFGPENGADGTDLQTAWRETLLREGKISDDATSLRDLVLGPTKS